jgi:hypothetical protein
MSEKRLTRSTSAALTPATNLLNNELLLSVEKKRNNSSSNNSSSNPSQSSSKRKLAATSIESGGEYLGESMMTNETPSSLLTDTTAVKQIISSIQQVPSRHATPSGNAASLRTSSRLSKCNNNQNNSNINNNSTAVSLSNSETSSSSIASGSDQNNHEQSLSPLPPEPTVLTTSLLLAASAASKRSTFQEKLNENGPVVKSETSASGQETSTSTSTSSQASSSLSTSVSRVAVNTRKSLLSRNETSENTNHNQNHNQQQIIEGGQKISTRRRSSNYLNHIKSGASFSSLSNNFLDQSFPNLTRSKQQQQENFVGWENIFPNVSLNLVGRVEIC